MTEAIAKAWNEYRRKMRGYLKDEDSYRAGWQEVLLALKPLSRKWHKHAKTCSAERLAAQGRGDSNAAGVWAQEAITKRGCAEELDAEINRLRGVK